MNSTKSNKPPSHKKPITEAKRLLQNGQEKQRKNKIKACIGEIAKELPLNRETVNCKQSTLSVVSQAKEYIRQLKEQNQAYESSSFAEQQQEELKLLRNLQVEHVEKITKLEQDLRTYAIQKLLKQKPSNDTSTLRKGGSSSKRRRRPNTISKILDSERKKCISGTQSGFHCQDRSLSALRPDLNHHQHSSNSSGSSMAPSSSILLTAPPSVISIMTLAPTVLSSKGPTLARTLNQPVGQLVGTSSSVSVASGFRSLKSSSLDSVPDVALCGVTNALKNSDGSFGRDGAHTSVVSSAAASLPSFVSLDGVRLVVNGGGEGCLQQSSGGGGLQVDTGGGAQMNSGGRGSTNSGSGIVVNGVGGVNMNSSVLLNSGVGVQINNGNGIQVNSGGGGSTNSGSGIQLSSGSGVVVNGVGGINVNNDVLLNSGRGISINGGVQINIAGGVGVNSGSGVQINSGGSTNSGGRIVVNGVGGINMNSGVLFNSGTGTKINSGGSIWINDRAQVNTAGGIGGSGGRTNNVSGIIVNDVGGVNMNSGVLLNSETGIRINGRALLNSAGGVGINGVQANSGSAVSINDGSGVQMNNGDSIRISSGAQINTADGVSINGGSVVHINSACEAQINGGVQINSAGGGVPGANMQGQHFSPSNSHQQQQMSLVFSQQQNGLALSVHPQTTVLASSHAADGQGSNVSGNAGFPVSLGGASLMFSLRQKSGVQQSLSLSEPITKQASKPVSFGGQIFAVSDKATISNQQHQSTASSAILQSDKTCIHSNTPARAITFLQQSNVGSSGGLTTIGQSFSVGSSSGSGQVLPVSPGQPLIICTINDQGQLVPVHPQVWPFQTSSSRLETMAVAGGSVVSKLKNYQEGNVKLVPSSVQQMQQSIFAPSSLIPVAVPEQGSGQAVTLLMPCPANPLPVRVVPDSLLLATQQQLPQQQVYNLTSLRDLEAVNLQANIRNGSTVRVMGVSHTLSHSGPSPAGSREPSYVLLDGSASPVSTGDPLKIGEDDVNDVDCASSSLSTEEEEQEQPAAEVSVTSAQGSLSLSSSEEAEITKSCSMSESEKAQKIESSCMQGQSWLERQQIIGSHSQAKEKSLLKEASVKSGVLFLGRDGDVEHLQEAEVRVQSGNMEHSDVSVQIGDIEHLQEAGVIVHGGNMEHSDVIVQSGNMEHSDILVQSGNPERSDVIIHHGSPEHSNVINQSGYIAPNEVKILAFSSGISISSDQASPQAVSTPCISIPLTQAEHSNPCVSESAHAKLPTVSTPCVSLPTAEAKLGFQCISTSPTQTKLPTVPFPCILVSTTQAKLPTVSAPCMTTSTTQSKLSTPCISEPAQTELPTVPTPCTSASLTQANISTIPAPYIPKPTPQVKLPFPCIFKSPIPGNFPTVPTPCSSMSSTKTTFPAVPTPCTSAKGLPCKSKSSTEANSVTVAVSCMPESAQTKLPTVSAPCISISAAQAKLPFPCISLPSSQAKFPTTSTPYMSESVQTKLSAVSAPCFSVSAAQTKLLPWISISPTEGNLLTASTPGISVSAEAKLPNPCMSFSAQTNHPTVSAPCISISTIQAKLSTVSTPCISVEKTEAKPSAVSAHCASVSTAQAKLLSPCISRSSAQGNLLAVPTSCLSESAQIKLPTVLAPYMSVSSTIDQLKTISTPCTSISTQAKLPTVSTPCGSISSAPTGATPCISAKDSTVFTLCNSISSTEANLPTVSTPCISVSSTETKHPAVSTPCISTKSQTVSILKDISALASSCTVRHAITKPCKPLRTEQNYNKNSSSSKPTSSAETADITVITSQTETAVSSQPETAVSSSLMELAVNQESKKRKRKDSERKNYKGKKKMLSKIDVEEHRIEQQEQRKRAEETGPVGVHVGIESAGHVLGFKVITNEVIQEQILHTLSESNLLNADGGQMSLLEMVDKLDMFNSETGREDVFFSKSLASDLGKNGCILSDTGFISEEVLEKPGVLDSRQISTKSGKQYSQHMPAKSGKRDSQQMLVKSRERDSRQLSLKSKEQDSQQMPKKSGKCYSRQMLVKHGERDSQQMLVKSKEQDPRLMSVKSGKCNSQQMVVKSGKRDSRQMLLKSGERNSQQILVKPGKQDSRQMFVKNKERDFQQDERHYRNVESLEINSYTKPKNLDVEMAIHSDIGVVEINAGSSGSSSSSNICDLVESCNVSGDHFVQASFVTGESASQKLSECEGLNDNDGSPAKDADVDEDVVHSFSVSFLSGAKKVSRSESSVKLTVSPAFDYAGLGEIACASAKGRTLSLVNRVSASSSVFTVPLVTGHTMASLVDTERLQTSSSFPGPSVAGHTMTSIVNTEKLQTSSSFSGPSMAGHTMTSIVNTERLQTSSSFLGPSGTEYTMTSLANRLPASSLSFMVPSLTEQTISSINTSRTVASSSLLPATSIPKLTFAPGTTRTSSHTSASVVSPLLTLSSESEHTIFAPAMCKTSSSTYAASSSLLPEHTIFSPTTSKTSSNTSVASSSLLTLPSVPEQTIFTPTMWKTSSSTRAAFSSLLPLSSVPENTIFAQTTSRTSLSTPVASSSVNASRHIAISSFLPPLSAPQLSMLATTVSKTSSLPNTKVSLTSSSSVPQFTPYALTSALVKTNGPPTSSLLQIPPLPELTSISSPLLHTNKHAVVSSHLPVYSLSELPSFAPVTSVASSLVNADRSDLTSSSSPLLNKHAVVSSHLPAYSLSELPSFAPVTSMASSLENADRSSTSSLSLIPPLSELTSACRTSPVLNTNTSSHLPMFSLSELPSFTTSICVPTSLVNADRSHPSSSLVIPSSLSQPAIKCGTSSLVNTDKSSSLLPPCSLSEPVAKCWTSTSSFVNADKPPSSSLLLPPSLSETAATCRTSLLNTDLHMTSSLLPIPSVLQLATFAPTTCWNSSLESTSGSFASSSLSQVPSIAELTTSLPNTGRAVGTSSLPAPSLPDMIFAPTIYRTSSLLSTSVTSSLSLPVSSTPGLVASFRTASFLNTGISSMSAAPSISEHKTLALASSSVSSLTNTRVPLVSSSLLPVTASELITLAPAACSVSSFLNTSPSVASYSSLLPVPSASQLTAFASETCKTSYTSETVAPPSSSLLLTSSVPDFTTFVPTACRNRSLSPSSLLPLSSLSEPAMTCRTSSLLNTNVYVTSSSLLPIPSVPDFTTFLPAAHRTSSLLNTSRSLSSSSSLPPSSLSELATSSMMSSQLTSVYVTSSSLFPIPFVPDLTTFAPQTCRTSSLANTVASPSSLHIPSLFDHRATCKTSSSLQNTSIPLASSLFPAPVVPERTLLAPQTCRTSSLVNTASSSSLHVPSLLDHTATSRTSSSLLNTSSLLPTPLVPEHTIFAPQTCRTSSITNPAALSSTFHLPSPSDHTATSLLNTSMPAVSSLLPAPEQTIFAPQTCKTSSLANAGTPMASSSLIPVESSPQHTTTFQASSFLNAGKPVITSSLLPLPSVLELMTFAPTTFRTSSSLNTSIPIASSSLLPIPSVPELTSFIITSTETFQPSITSTASSASASNFSAISIDSSNTTFSFSKRFVPDTGLFSTLDEAFPIEFSVMDFQISPKLTEPHNGRSSSLGLSGETLASFLNQQNPEKAIATSNSSAVFSRAILPSDSNLPSFLTLPSSVDKVFSDSLFSLDSQSQAGRKLFSPIANNKHSLSHSLDSSPPGPSVGSLAVMTSKASIAASLSTSSSSTFTNSSFSVLSLSTPVSASHKVTEISRNFPDNHYHHAVSSSSSSHQFPPFAPPSSLDAFSDLMPLKPITSELERGVSGSIAHHKPKLERAIDGEFAHQKPELEREVSGSYVHQRPESLSRDVPVSHVFSCSHNLSSIAPLPPAKLQASPSPAFGNVSPSTHSHKHLRHIQEGNTPILDQGIIPSLSHLPNPGSNFDQLFPLPDFALRDMTFTSPPSGSRTKNTEPPVSESGHDGNLSLRGSHRGPSINQGPARHQKSQYSVESLMESSSNTSTSSSLHHHHHQHHHNQGSESFNFASIGSNIDGSMASSSTTFTSSEFTSFSFCLTTSSHPQPSSSSSFSSSSSCDTSTIISTGSMSSMQLPFPSTGMHISHNSSYLNPIFQPPPTNNLSLTSSSYSRSLHPLRRMEIQPPVSQQSSKGLSDQTCVFGPSSLITFGNQPSIDIPLSKTQSQGANNIPSLDISKTPNQSANSFPSFDIPTISKTQSQGVINFLDIPTISKTQSHSANSFLDIPTISKIQSDSANSFPSLDISTISKTQGTNSFLDIATISKTHTQSANSFLSFDIPTVSKTHGQSANSFHSLDIPTISNTPSHCSNSFLDITMISKTQSHCANSFASLDIPTISKAQSTNSFLEISMISKSHNESANSFQSLDIPTISKTPIQGANSFPNLDIPTISKTHSKSTSSFPYVNHSSVASKADSNNKSPSVGAGSSVGGFDSNSSKNQVLKLESVHQQHKRSNTLQHPPDSGASNLDVMPQLPSFPHSNSFFSVGFSASPIESLTTASVPLCHLPDTRDTSMHSAYSYRKSRPHGVIGFPHSGYSHSSFDDTRVESDQPLKHSLSKKSSTSVGFSNAGNSVSSNINTFGINSVCSYRSGSSTIADSSKTPSQSANSFLDIPMISKTKSQGANSFPCFDIPTISKTQSQSTNSFLEISTISKTPIVNPIHSAALISHKAPLQQLFGQQQSLDSSTSHSRNSSSAQKRKNVSSSSSSSSSKRKNASHIPGFPLDPSDNTSQISHENSLPYLNFPPLTQNISPQPVSHHQQDTTPFLTGIFNTQTRPISNLCPKTSDIPPSHFSLFPTRPHNPFFQSPSFGMNPGSHVNTTGLASHSVGMPPSMPTFSLFGNESSAAPESMPSSKYLHTNPILPDSPHQNLDQSHHQTPVTLYHSHAPHSSQPHMMAAFYPRGFDSRAHLANEVFSSPIGPPPFHPPSLPPINFTLHDSH